MTMILHIRSDGSNEDALRQIVQQHRPTFGAGLDLDYARQWCDTVPAPEAGSACSELLEDAHAPTPRERARQARRLGAVCLVTFVAVVCFAMPLAAHFVAKDTPKPTKQSITLRNWA